MQMCSIASHTTTEVLEHRRLPARKHIVTSQGTQTTSADSNSIGHGEGAHVPPLLHMTGKWGHCEYKYSKQENDQCTDITKVLTKRIIAEPKMGGKTKIFSQRFVPGVPPTYEFIPA